VGPRTPEANSVRHHPRMRSSPLLADRVRGFVWAIYVDDGGRSWTKRVDADQVEDPGRGWSQDAVADWPPLPRGWLPRKVRGLDEEGREGFAVVARLDAPLWVGTQASFTVEGSDQLPHEAVVIERFAEKQVSPKVPPTMP